MNREDPIYADIEEIRKASERAGILTNQLLAFSRKQAITPIVFNPNESILQSKNMLERIIGEDIEFCFSPQEDLWQLKADPGQMDQVLVNLVVNARDAMINGGKLTLETTNVSLENAVDTETQEIHSGNFVMLAVSDTGHGMSPGTREHIFEPFFTTKEKNKGTGLGLATVYGIVKQNNGFINVFSEPDIGTTIKIFFPAITSSFPPENHF
jgi:signal transduction histidine kinase